MNKIKYTTLFDYATKNFDLGWNECHRIFFKTKAIKFNGISDYFYLDDLEDEINNEALPPLWSESYGRAMEIVRYYMRDNGYNELKFYS